MKNTPDTVPSLSRTVVLLMSAACGLSVASNYYAQPLLQTIADLFSLSVNQAGSIVTVAQLGYAFGLLFLVPLGDRYNRRPLIVIMTLLTALGMLITASSHSLWLLLAGTALTGLFSVVAQIILPLAITLAVPEKRGKVLGTVMTGLLLGILLARTASGLVADIGGWRAIYWLASGFMLLMALALWRTLPVMPQSTQMNYLQLLVSIFSLFRNDKILFTRMLLGFMVFACFSNLWTSLAFLLAGPPFNFSDSMIGLFGLVGAAGVLGARTAGTFASNGKAHLITSYGLVLILICWIILALGQHSLLALIIGILLLDLLTQVVHITNQSVIYQSIPEARNRLTAGYMTSFFLGGAMASSLSAFAYHMAGWIGVCLAGGALSCASLIIWWLGYHRQPVAA